MSLFECHDRSSRFVVPHARSEIKIIIETMFLPVGRLFPFTNQPTCAAEDSSDNSLYSDYRNQYVLVESAVPHLPRQ